MLKKILSLILAICMLATMTLCLCSCKDSSNGEYPVTVGDITIEEEPLNIVVLSDCFADIISYMGYDVKMVGRSIECDQEFLSVVPLVGTAASPDIDSIVSYETDLVIADDSISDASKQQLSDNSIQVLTLKKPTSFEETHTIYNNLGTALGGREKGKTKGQSAYDELINTLNTYENAIPTSTVKSACYLYLDETGTLCTLTKGSLEYEMFDYCGAINVFPDQENPQVDLSQLKFATPSCIFYDNDAVLTFLKNNAELSDMAALTQNETFMVKKSDFNRLGVTFEENIYRMIEFMFIEESTPDEATQSSENTAETTETTTETTAEAPSETIVGFVE